MARAAFDLRWAVHSDRAALMALLVEMHGDVGIFPLALVKLENTIDEMLERGCILVAVQDQVLIGSIGLYLGDFWYSEEKVLMDMWIYTSARAKRRLNVFRAMIAEARDFAQREGFPLILTLFCESDEKRKSGLFARYGDMVLKGFKFMPVGGDFRMK